MPDKLWPGLKQQLLACCCRQASDPKELLKCINPREATLIDPAAGIHIRFRLGGATFPPTVLYKIFTHAPVADVCSLCPRDYVKVKPDRPLQTCYWFPSRSSTPPAGTMLVRQAPCCPAGRAQAAEGAT